MLDSVMVPPPAVERLTVHVLDVPGLKVEGEQAKLLIDGAPFKAIDAVRDVLFREAVIVAL